MDVEISPELAARDGLIKQQVGWLIEGDLDRALLIGSGGRLHPYPPVIDVHEVDRVYAWDGVGRPWYVQVKGATVPLPDGRWRWNFRAGHFIPYDRFHAVLCIADPVTGRLQDPVWNVPAAEILRLAVHDADAGGPRLNVRASLAGHDALSRYRTTLVKLWETFAPPVPGAPAPMVPLEFPVLNREQGSLYELAQIVELLRGSENDLCMYRPAIDIAGRDLLVQLVDSPQALFVQTKGTARQTGPDSIELIVPRSSFQPADNLWLSFYLYQREKRALFPDCWLIPSLEFAERTAHQQNVTNLLFETRLSLEHDRWRDHRHPITEQAAVFRRALSALRPG